MQEIVLVLCLIVFNFELLDILLDVFISRCAVESQTFSGINTVLVQLKFRKQ